MNNIISGETTKQAGKFAAVGVINTAVDFIVLNILIYFGFTLAFVVLGQEFLVANVISVAVAMVNSFILNKQWTFKAETANIYLEIVKFIVVTVIGMFVVHQIIFNVLYYNLPAISSAVISIVNILRLNSIFSNEFVRLNFAKSIAIVASLIWNFVGYKFIVFKSRANS
ncbi:hypothetical protein A2999_00795 [Candidatus Wolfebacteria bacterium RIFCSPLOWO2_01_FULL_38_11]|uniref:Glycosyl transferase family 2 n=2 Tax=Candidatus Wolfeibacteriota TaxID=1752735 RepID=A0A0G0ID83_9BACT|nr:MAG: Glycosyl transferase family 2 [Candidatus Wolfebacteria bacterium GW2011_GWC1_37_10]OGM90461.1 MAG: hypothetical protein A2999_00795 [Candidatus Wolfebacteria bacterium RIFCSPLOWO2_01_FULL_38_11]